MKLDSLVTVAEETLDKDTGQTAGHYWQCKTIMSPLHTVISNQWSLFSDSLLLPKYRTNRLKNPFVPHAIILYNSSLGGRRKAKRTEVKDW